MMTMAINWEEARLRTKLMDFDNECFQSENDVLPAINLDVKHELAWKTLGSHNFNVQTLKLHFGLISQEEREVFFDFGIACISKFVQANFTGPELESDIDEFLSSDSLKSVEFVNALAVNNEEINVNVNYPCLLVAAEIIFRSCHVCDLLNLWWQWRAILIHQHILEDLSPTLLTNVENLQKELREINLTSYLRALFEIEQAQLYCEFSSIGKADKHIKAASEILGLKYELLGKLGKRTKHQEKDVAQLMLEVSLVEKEDVLREDVKEIPIPQNLSLNDDVRLDTTKFTEDNKLVSFPNLEQKLLMVIVHHMIISKPQDDLYYEELRPFLELILNQTNTWCVRACALLIRCKLEAKHNRTVERSFMQCEEVINSTKKDKPSMMNRVGAVYSTGICPIWKVEAQYADLMLNLGLIKASLEVYLSLQLWEEVIVCYTILKMRHKAAEIIKMQLEVKPTVKLYCLLGDATDDISCYEKAWEFSKRRSHRAQRHWGQYFFLRKKYPECIPHFEKSVSINPLQGIVWLRLGFAALETQNWHVAATAYRRYTTLEPDGFEAWNNLAQAYIKLGNKRNAHHALQDALRCNFDNWKVWENFLVVSADIANYSDVVRSYHKMLDLKGKYLNADVLKVLVYGVCTEPFESDVSLMKRTRELLGRILSAYPAEAILWELYACVAPIPLLKIQRLQRAYRGYTQGTWTKDINTCKHVLYICLKLGEAVLEECINSRDTVINSVRLNISSAISVIKKMEYAETKVLLQEVTSVLARIIEKSKNASS